MSDEIMTTEEAAVFLKLSESALYRLLQQGEIPGGTIGGQWRLRRSDLERAFDLARARTTAEQREKVAKETWEPEMWRLSIEHPGTQFVLTRCLWCSEHAPALEGARYTTLCSSGCSAELRRAFRLLGWPLGDIVLSPVFGIKGGDLTELMLDSRGLVAEVMYGIGPIYELTRIPEQKRHERGPLREQLLMDSSLLRAYLLGGSSPPDNSAHRNAADAGNGSTPEAMEASGAG